MIINTNLGALNAHRLMKSNNAQSQKAMEKLSSGKKINSAADNAAGLSISEKMKAQIRGLEQATLNTQQGIDLIKTSDGAMGEIHSILQRMRELSVQAASDTNTDEDRKSIQLEITQLSKQIDSVSKTTEFNTIKTIDGSLRNLPPTNAVEVGKSVVCPISIHDDTSASIMSSSAVNFDDGIEIHDGKPAVTELKLNTPINITNPYNNKLTINYIDENSNSHLKTLNLVNGSNPVAQTPSDLKTVIQNAINNDSDLTGKINVQYTTSPDSIIFKSTIKESNVKINMANSSALAEMVGRPYVGSYSLKNPIKISNVLPTKNNVLLVNYNDVNGASYSETLNLPAYDSSTALNHPQDLANIVQSEINKTSLNGKIFVGIQGAATYGYQLTLTSRDRGYYTGVNFVGFNNSINESLDASKDMFYSSTIIDRGLNSPTVVSGTTRNDQLKITFSDKTKAAETKWSEDRGFTIEDSQWASNNTFYIKIPNDRYTSGSDFVTALNNAIKNDAYVNSDYSTKANLDYSTKVKADFNKDNIYSANGEIKFTTVNEGAEASLQLQDVNSAKKSNMFSILHLNPYTAYGQDKTDTFAIEVNAQYTEKELDDKDLSAEDIQKLLNNETIYTPNGYIIQDPLNPCDFIEYTKIQGTGEIQQITLATRDYASKEEFAGALESAINNSTNQLGNDVKVTVNNSTGGFNISTTQQDGAKSSVRFVIPPNPSVPGNQSPINTSMDELLNNFLNVTGFEYNRHVGKNGTGKMDIQVGANSNQDVLVKIGSVRAGALGVKYLDVTTSQKASEAISTIDDAINKVSGERTNLGAFQNAFEHVVSNLENTSNNLTSAQSGIEDADMSKEIMMWSKNNILQQAAQAMLAQANQEPQKVLQLLKQS